MKDRTEKKVSLMSLSDALSDLEEQYGFLLRYDRDGELIASDHDLLSECRVAIENIYDATGQLQTLTTRVRHHLWSLDGGPRAS